MSDKPLEITDRDREILQRAGVQANSRQVGGEHYGLKKRQHWDIVNEFRLDYFQGQITKYVMRWRNKGGLQDLEKARHFLEKYIELNQPKKMSGDDAIYERHAMEKAAEPTSSYVNQDRQHKG